MSQRWVAWRPLAMATLLAMFATGSASAGEVTVYEWREANGTTSYSGSRPPPGSQDVKSREFDTRSFTPAQKLAVKSYLGRLDATALTEAKRFRLQVAVADRKVDDELRQLAAAESALRAGRAPRADERVGNRGGGSRLRPEYFDRQKQLEAAVQQAQMKLTEASKLRDDLTP